MRNLDSFVKDHKVLATLIASVTVAVFWVATTFATIGYVDKNVAQIRYERAEILIDIRERLKRIENMLQREYEK